MGHQDGIEKRLERLLSSSFEAPIQANLVRELMDELSDVKAALAGSRDMAIRLGEKVENLESDRREIHRLAKEAALKGGPAMRLLVDQVDGGRAGVTYREAYVVLKKAAGAIARHFPPIDETRIYESATQMLPPRTVPMAGEVMSLHLALGYTELP